MNQDPSTNTPEDFEETRIHILTASRELLLAAKGALQFCCKYVETSKTSAPNLVTFFKKAMNVADDLSSGLKNMDAIKKAATQVVKPIFTALEEEMSSEKRNSGTSDFTGTSTTNTAKIRRKIDKKTKQL